MGKEDRTALEGAEERGGVAGGLGSEDAANAVFSEGVSESGDGIEARRESGGEDQGVVGDLVAVFGVDELFVGIDLGGGSTEPTDAFGQEVTKRLFRFRRTGQTCADHRPQGKVGHGGGGLDQGDVGTFQEFEKASSDGDRSRFTAEDHDRFPCRRNEGHTKILSFYSRR